MAKADCPFPMALTWEEKYPTKYQEPRFDAIARLERRLAISEVTMESMSIPVIRPLITGCECCTAAGRLRPEDAPTLIPVPVRVGTMPGQQPTNTTDSSVWRYGTVPQQVMEHTWLCPRCLGLALGSFLTYLNDGQRRKWLAEVRTGNPAAASLVGRG